MTEEELRDIKASIKCLDGAGWHVAANQLDDLLAEVRRKGKLTKERLYDVLCRSTKYAGFYVSDLYDNGRCRIDCEFDLQEVVDALNEAGPPSSPEPGSPHL